VRRAYSLIELLVAFAIVSLMTAAALPRVAAWFDWLAVEQAAQRVTLALSATRNAAALRGTQARLELGQDSLRVDEWTDRTWIPVLRWPGATFQGVTLTASNPTVAFDALGIGVGFANTKIVLSRGLHIATITTSRLGRVKRW